MWFGGNLFTISAIYITNGFKISSLLPQNIPSNLFQQFFIIFLYVTIQKLWLFFFVYRSETLFLIVAYLYLWFDFLRGGEVRGAFTVQVIYLRNDSIFLISKIWTVLNVSFIKKSNNRPQVRRVSCRIHFLQYSKQLLEDWQFLSDFITAWDATRRNININ